MNRPGNEFFAGSGFPGDENRSWRWRDLPHCCDYVADSRTVTDDFATLLLFRDFALQICSFCFEFAQAVLRSQLILHIAQNEAKSTAAFHVKPRNARLRSKGRAIAAQGAQSSRYTGKRLACAVEAFRHRTQFLRTGWSEKLCHFATRK